MMGLFGNVNDGITDEVDRATSEKNVEEDWGLIMTICDKAGRSTEEAKNYLKAIVRKLYNSNPHVGLKAVTLLDACVKNSDKTFHIEVASRDFENDFTKLLTKAHPHVSKKLKESLKRWSENEFKSDPQLSLIPTLYQKLKSNGHDFTTVEQPKRTAQPMSKDPNVVESQEEEDQILKAIELSLKQSGSPRQYAATATNNSTTNSASLYPSVNAAATAAAAAPAASAKEPRKVRALYDFEAAEDNELTFETGEIIVVLDDSDTNWWKGSNHRGEGLFPANFVTSDLSVEPEKFLFEKAKKMVQFKDSAEIKELDEPEEVEVDERKIDGLLHMLHEADPTDPEKDTEEMLNAERGVNMMGPLIDSELELLDRKHAQLTQLSTDLVEALGLYHSLMREPRFPQVNKVPFGYPAPPQMPFNAGMPPHVMGGPQQQPDPQYLQRAAGGPQQQQQGLPFQSLPPNPAAQQQQQQQQGGHMSLNEQQMAQYQIAGPGPGYPPPPNMLHMGPHPQFHPHPMGSLSQPNIQNGGAPPQQQQQQQQQPPPPHFVSSSTHLTH